MTYVLFDYKPGHVEARFSHGPKFDLINLDIRMVGDIAITTDCDEQGRKAAPVNRQRETTNLTVRMSSVFCAFKDFIRFLEAITLEVQDVLLTGKPKVWIKKICLCIIRKSETTPP